MSLSQRVFWGLFLFAIIIRLLTLAGYPLMDTTESRYGEMARLMVETGNWLTPQIDYNIPFWGKPPLFIWISALGIHFFGVNEFALRFPHWLAGLITLALTALFCQKLKLKPGIAALVLATCGIFSVASGAVMTDMMLTLSQTLTMLCIFLGWQRYQQKNSLDGVGRVWGYLAFIGLAIGLLSKGPVVIALVSIAVVPWLVVQHGVVGALNAFWKRFPLVSGGMLMLAIALPWYIAAERATPGFLNYFIIGEHFKRFTVSGWQGDLYGSAHHQVRGTIWFYWLYSAAPWSLALPFLLWKRKACITRINQSHQGLFSFLCLWMLSPMVMFTFAGNILPAYILPGVPGLAILLALLLKEDDKAWFIKTSLLVPLVLIIAFIYLQFGITEKRSDKYLLQGVKTAFSIYYQGKRPFSAQFYSQGKAQYYDQAISSKGEQPVYLLGKKQEVAFLIKANNLACTLELTAKSKRSRYLCSR